MKSDRLLGRREAPRHRVFHPEVKGLQCCQIEAGQFDRLHGAQKHAAKPVLLQFRYIARLLRQLPYQRNVQVPGNYGGVCRCCVQYAPFLGG